MDKTDDLLDWRVMLANSGYLAARVVKTHLLDGVISASEKECNLVSLPAHAQDRHIARLACHWLHLCCTCRLLLVHQYLIVIDRVDHALAIPACCSQKVVTSLLIDRDILRCEFDCTDGILSLHIDHTV